MDIPGHTKLVVSGPYVHENLAIFIFHSDERVSAEKIYITLEEGMKKKLVKITESKRAEVQQLLVTNKSELPLYLQVGELVRGGKQDRTLQTSLVIPPKTRKVPIPSFCVEQNRWSGGEEFAAAATIAPAKETRIAIQSGDQGKVWSSVRSYKSSVRDATGLTASSSSSVNEELDSKEFVTIMGNYVSPLKDAPNKFVRPVGLAYAVNGQISTVDVYNSPVLFKKLYPKLLKTAAAEAAASPGKKTESVIPTADQAVEFITSSGDGKKQEQKLGHDNTYVRIFGQTSLTAQLLYKEAVVHTQVIATDGKPVPLPEPVLRTR